MGPTRSLKWHNNTQATFFRKLWLMHDLSHAVLTKKTQWLLIKPSPAFYLHQSCILTYCCYFIYFSVFWNLDVIRGNNFLSKKGIASLHWVFTVIFDAYLSHFYPFWRVSQPQIWDPLLSWPNLGILLGYWGKWGVQIAHLSSSLWSFPSLSLFYIVLGFNMSCKSLLARVLM